MHGFICRLAPPNRVFRAAVAIAVPIAVAAAAAGLPAAEVEDGFEAAAVSWRESTRGHGPANVGGPR